MAGWQPLILPWFTQPPRWNTLHNPTPLAFRAVRGLSPCRFRQCVHDFVYLCTRSVTSMRVSVRVPRLPARFCPAGEARFVAFMSVARGGREMCKASGQRRGTMSRGKETLAASAIESAEEPPENSRAPEKRFPTVSTTTFWGCCGHKSVCLCVVSLRSFPPSQLSERNTLLCCITASSTNAIPRNYRAESTTDRQMDRAT